MPASKEKEGDAQWVDRGIFPLPANHAYDQNMLMNQGRVKKWIDILKRTSEEDKIDVDLGGMAVGPEGAHILADFLRVK